eukprot:4240711-Alexandrium_andersonii.AAC.1
MDRGAGTARGLHSLMYHTLSTFHASTLLSALLQVVVKLIRHDHTRQLTLSTSRVYCLLTGSAGSCCNSCCVLSGGPDAVRAGGARLP